MTEWSDIVFSNAIRDAQTKFGTREKMARMDKRKRTAKLDENLQAFIKTRDSIYFGTAGQNGQPYIQHRGGPPGFIRVIDARTLAFAEYDGNKQLITTGNLAENPKAFIFLMDYPNRQRLKLWGTAEIVDDPDIVASLSDEIPGAPKPERALKFTVEAWDLNCPKYILPRYTEPQVAQATEILRTRIAELEAEVARLKA